MCMNNKKRLTPPPPSMYNYYVLIAEAYKIYNFHSFEIDCIVNYAVSDLFFLNMHNYSIFASSD